MNGVKQSTSHAVPFTSEVDGIVGQLGRLYTPAKPEPGPTPAPDAMYINGCFHTQPVRHISVPGAGSAAGLSVSM